MIRKAEKKDLSRIAEILVFDKRMNYRSIFKNDDYSFHVLQVLDVAKEYAQPEILDHIFVYDDGIVKGLIHLEQTEIAEFYVDHFFQNQGIGAALMEYAALRLVQPHLPQGITTVGTQLDIRHESATPEGMRVWAVATLTETDGRRFLFEITAYDEVGVIGRGTHERCSVRQASFEEKARLKLKA